MFASREIHVGNAVIGPGSTLGTNCCKAQIVSLECGAQGAVPLPVPGLGGRGGGERTGEGAA